MSSPNPFPDNAGEERLAEEWCILPAAFEELKRIVGQVTYQDLVLDRLRRDKKDDLYIILSRLADRGSVGRSGVLPGDRPALMPMMDVLSRVLAVDAYLEKLLGTAAFSKRFKSPGGESSATPANPGRTRVLRSIRHRGS